AHEASQARVEGGLALQHGVGVDLVKQRDVLWNGRGGGRRLPRQGQELAAESPVPQNRSDVRRVHEAPDLVLLPVEGGRHGPYPLVRGVGVSVEAGMGGVDRDRAPLRIDSQPRWIV